ncbi:MAG: SpoIIE family protein phosphatase [Candidatus Riflebacteria bacterium]|nr:SpoIIE family protein phosphatase [Candidatus Riflebacteria bacterium]
MSEDARKITLFLARLTFALVLPVYLIWLILVSHFTMQRDNEIQSSFATLDLALDNLENLHDDRAFLHAVLQKNFVMADRSDQPQKQLENRIRAFRKLFGERISFVVYDGNGAINKKLTEEDRFQYVLKSMFEVMVLLRQYFVSDPFADPASFDKINQRINLLRGYFGPYLLPAHLFAPLRPGYLGSCLTVSDESARKLLWYYPGDNFSLACFIDARLQYNQIGPRLIVQHFNHGAQPEKLAYVKTRIYGNFGLPLDRGLASQLLIEVRNFESYAVSKRQSRDFLVNIRQVSHDLIVLSYLDKSGIAKPEQRALALLLNIFRWLFVGGFILYCLSLRHYGFCLSVPQKMLLLFVFANGLPLLMLVSTGYEYFNEKKSELINAAHQESLRILREFDLRFPEVSNSLAQRMNAFIDERNQLYGKEQWPEAEIEKLNKLLLEIDPQEAALFEAGGRRRLYISNSTDRAERLVTSMLMKAIVSFNRNKVEETVKRDSMLAKMSSDDLMLHYFLSTLDRFSMLGAGTSERFTYLKFMGDQKNADLWGILGVSWDRNRFLQAFTPGRLEQSRAAVLPRLLAVMDKKSERIFALQNAETPVTRRLMRQTSSRKLITEKDVELDGQRYLFTSIPGNELSEGILVAFYPQNIIDTRINRLKIAIALVILLVFAVLFQIVRLFSRRLLLPVEALAEGIGHIRAGDFKYRVDFQSEDELGQLINVFNQTMKDMQDLALGTSVQVSLLPAEKYRRGSVRLFARSLFMSKMGGDYYDYFDLPENRLGIFFGDVAGHGIPAAMIMSMAKAVISSMQKDFAGPADLLGRTNKILLKLRERNWRRMMTAQVISLDCQSGEFVISNAGHCYPYIVGKDGSSATPLEINGMPLGSASKKAHSESAAIIGLDETLVLYTDGIVESVNVQGEMFGYRRFAMLLQSAWADDLEEYWKNIMSGYKSWAVNQDDDLTFMIIRLSGESR